MAESETRKGGQMVDPLFIHLTKRLRVVARGFNKYSKYLQEHHKITIPQIICLREVHEHGPITLGALTKIVALNNSTVTGIVDRLENQQLLQRTRTSSDRRQIHLQMTEKGVRFLTDIPTPVPQRFIEGIQHFSHDEIDRIVWSVDQLAMLLGGDESEPTGIGELPDKSAFGFEPGSPQ
jgi:MarR family transcriptional regulator, organic hydroperoxide resistance regulator